jgi:hypothetical protein
MSRTSLAINIHGGFREGLLMPKETRFKSFSSFIGLNYLAKKIKTDY